MRCVQLPPSAAHPSFPFPAVNRRFMGEMPQIVAGTSWRAGNSVYLCGGMP